MVPQIAWLFENWATAWVTTFKEQFDALCAGIPHLDRLMPHVRYTLKYFITAFAHSPLLHRRVVLVLLALNSIPIFTYTSLRIFFYLLLFLDSLLLNITTLLLQEFYNWSSCMSLFIHLFRDYSRWYYLLMLGCHRSLLLCLQISWLGALCENRGSYVKFL